MTNIVEVDSVCEAPLLTSTFGRWPDEPASRLRLNFTIELNVALEICSVVGGTAALRLPAWSRSEVVKWWPTDPTRTVLFWSGHISCWCDAVLLHRLTDWFLWGRCGHPSVSQQLINTFLKSDRYSVWPRYRLSNRCLISSGSALCPARLYPAPPSPSTNQTDPTHPGDNGKDDDFQASHLSVSVRTMSHKTTSTKHTVCRFSGVTHCLKKVHEQTPQEIWHAIKPQQGHFKLRSSTHTLSPPGIF